MDDRLRTENITAGWDAELKAFTNRLIDERVADGEIDLRTMTFAEMETLGHEIGRRVAQMLDGQLTERQNETLYSDDYNCPSCGLECEAIKHPRTIQTVDGPTEIVELKSYCPKCRRYFFPGASRQRPR